MVEGEIHHEHAHNHSTKHANHVSVKSQHGNHHEQGQGPRQDKEIHGRDSKGA